MILDIILLVGGGLGVWLGAEGMVRGAVKLAAYFGVPPLIVGLTVIAFGTSAPELVVSAFASIEGHGEIALGNVLGSNIMNIALVLGISSIIAPLHVSTEVLRRDIPILVAVTLTVVVLTLIGKEISRIDSIILLSIFAAHTIYNYKLAVKEQSRTTMSPNWERPQLKGIHIVFLIGGIAVLSMGADGMVRGSVGLAKSFGISHRIIGMTIVAFGTSLPELAASIVAAKHGESDLALGTVVGSNLYNMTLILGTASMISPIHTGLNLFSPEILFFMITVLLLIPLIRVGWKLGRMDGLILLTIYGLAMFFLFY